MNSDSQNTPGILNRVDTLEKLEAFLKKKKKNSKDHSNYDILFRNFIKHDTDKEQLDHLLEIFLPKLDVNFQNQNDSSSTPLMYLISEGLISLCEEMIKKNGEKIDLTLKDSKGENIFFKIIYSSMENGGLNLFKQALNLLNETSEEDEKIETLNSINTAGKSLIETSLNIGNSEISSLLLMEGIDPKIKNNNNDDNILHFAVRGQNVYCLKLVLNSLDKEMIQEFFRAQNKDNETPIQLAEKMKNEPMIKLLNDISSGEKKNKSSEDNNEDEIFDLLAQITEDTTDKVIKTIKNNYYVSDWNELYLDIIKEYQPNHKFNINLVNKVKTFFGLISSFDNKTQDKELSNKKNEEETSPKKEGKSKINENVKLPITLNSTKNTEDNSSIATSNDDLSSKYSTSKNIYFLNKITAANLIGTTRNLLEIFKSYIKSNAYKEKEDNQNMNFIFYVNTIVILIEKCLSQNFIELASFFLSNLDKYLSSYNYEAKGFEFKTSNSNQYLKYLSSNEIITPNTNIKELIILYQCYLFLLQGNLDNAKEKLYKFKSSFFTNKKEKNNEKKGPIIISMERFYYYLKVRSEYYSNNQYKINKFISSPDVFKDNKDFLNVLFYYNCAGIINMKQTHFSLAEYCFKYCKNIINQNSMEYINYLPGIEYNLALCYYFIKDYDKAINIFNKIKNIETLSNNPYLFYRLALCYIEKEISHQKMIFKNSNENDIISKTILNNNCDEPAFKKRFLLVNQIPSKKGQAGQQEKKPTSNDIQENELQNGTNCNNIYPNKNLNEAIICLKECILIIKGHNSYYRQIYESFKTLSNNELINFESIFINKFNYIGNGNKRKDFEDENHFQYDDIYALAYLNLIFCLLRNENFAEALETINEFKEHDTTGKYKYALHNYSVEAYLRLGQFGQVLDILTKENFLNENIDDKGSFYTNSNKKIYNDVTYRLALYINLIKINILNKNMQEADKYIVSVLSLIGYPTEKELPSYIINIIIFYFLSLGKNEQAVQVIKYRRIPKPYGNQ